MASLRRRIENGTTTERDRAIVDFILGIILVGGILLGLALSKVLF